jgi:GAF domain-containing protein
MKKFLTVLFTVLLAVGWQWINTLKTAGTLGQDVVFGLGAVLTLCLLLQQSYVALGSPVPPERPSKAETIANAYLLSLLSKYYEFVQAVSPDRQPSVRINVMLPTSRWKLWRHLRIYYVATLPGAAVYTNEERVMPWRKGQGISGWVWKTGQPGLYDDQRPGFGLASESLSEAQKHSAGALKSVYSVPIWLDDEIVGILNLDSDANLDETRFDDPRVQHIVKTFADNLASVCFADGVRHK